MKKLSVAILSVLLSFQGAQAWSQEDPDYAIELQQNTVCGFINSNNVKIRADHSTKSKTIATLKRGDGVRAMSSREGNWVQIAARVYGFPPNESYKPLQGWVSNQYINGCAEDEFERWRN